MPINKFANMLQKQRMSCGATEVEARQYTTYPLRRFPPAAADNFKILEIMTEAVRDWQQATSARPLLSAMAAHYTHDRVTIAGDIKARLLMAVTQLVRRPNSAELHGI